MVTLVMHMHLIKISVLFYVLNLELAQDLIRSFRAWAFFTNFEFRISQNIITFFSYDVKFKSLSIYNHVEVKLSLDKIKKAQTVK